MRRFFVEDDAHDAVLKTLNFQGPEIQKCNGRGNTITQTLDKEYQSVGFIDRDNGITDSRLFNTQWEKEDDFNYAVKGNKLFICFTINVEDWLERAANQFHISLSGSATGLHGKISSRSPEARKFLEGIRDCENSPMIILRNVIRNHLG